MSKTQKIAVYGTLRKDQSNHRLIKDSKYLGSFETKPIFNMYSIGDGFPGIVLGGHTSVTMEVYEVDEATAAKVDSLEGYSELKKNNDFYDKKLIHTPYGEVSFYTYEANIEGLRVIKSGDWNEYMSIDVPLKNLIY